MWKNKNIKKEKEKLRNYPEDKDLFTFTRHFVHWRVMTRFINRRQVNLHIGRRVDTKGLAWLQSDMACKTGLEGESV